MRGPLPGGTTFAWHPGWRYGDALHPARRHCTVTVTQLSRRFWSCLNKEGDVALAWRSGCRSTIADKHCTSHAVESPPLQLPSLKKNPPKKPGVPGPQQPERGYKKRNDCTKNLNEGTFAKTGLSQNRPFVSIPFEASATKSFPKEFRKAQSDCKC